MIDGVHDGQYDEASRETFLYLLRVEAIRAFTLFLMAEAFQKEEAAGFQEAMDSTDIHIPLLGRQYMETSPIEDAVKSVAQSCFQYVVFPEGDLQSLLLCLNPRLVDGCRRNIRGRNPESPNAQGNGLSPRTGS